MQGTRSTTGWRRWRACCTVNCWPRGVCIYDTPAFCRQGGGGGQTLGHRRQLNDRPAVPLLNLEQRGGAGPLPSRGCSQQLRYRRGRVTRCAPPLPRAGALADPGQLRRLLSTCAAASASPAVLSPALRPSAHRRADPATAPEDRTLRDGTTPRVGQQVRGRSGWARRSPREAVLDQRCSQPPPAPGFSSTTSGLAAVRAGTRSIWPAPARPATRLTMSSAVAPTHARAIASERMAHASARRASAPATNRCRRGASAAGLKNRHRGGMASAKGSSSAARNPSPVNSRRGGASSRSVQPGLR